MSEIAAQLAELFQGNADWHGTHSEPRQEPGGVKWAIQSSALTLKGSATDLLWERHLKGEQPLGIVPICKGNVCFWGSLDYDVYDQDLLDLIGRIDRAKVPLVPVRSKSGGLHLFLFVSDPVPAADMVGVLGAMARLLGLNRQKTEVFPKQTNIVEGAKGSWIIAPYFGGTFDGKLQLQEALRPNGGALSVEEFIRASVKLRLSLEQFAKLPKATQTASTKKNGHALPTIPKGFEVGENVLFRDGPVCIQRIVENEEGIVSGNRNNTLFMVAIYLKRAYPDSWQDKLVKANSDYCRPPAPPEDIQSLIRSISRKDYNYTCSRDPMASICEGGLCRTRPFGVGDEGAGRFPLITKLRIIESAPKIYYPTVNGVEIEITTDEFFNYVKFQRASVDKLSRSFGGMKQDDWSKITDKLLINAEHVEPSPDAIVNIELYEAIEEFLTNRATGSRLEDLISGRPFTNENDKRYEFRLRDLHKFLNKDGQKIPRGKLSELLRGMGGEATFHNFENKQGLNFWILPFTAFQPRGE